MTPGAPPPSLRRHGAGLLVELAESMSAESSPQFPALREALERALLDGAVRLVIFDLSRTEYMDSTGIGLLVFARSWAKALGKALYIYRPGPQVAKALHLVHLAQAFTFLEDPAEMARLLETPA